MIRFSAVSETPPLRIRRTMKLRRAVHLLSVKELNGSHAMN